MRSSDDYSQCPATTSIIIYRPILANQCCFPQWASNLLPTARIIFVEEARHSLFAITLQTPLSKHKAIGREQPAWQASKFPLPLLLLMPATQARKSDAYLVYVVGSLCLQRPNSKSSIPLRCHDSGRSTPPL